MNYIQLKAQEALPSIEHLYPFKCLVIISESVSQARQDEISMWLVKSGCVVMCAWGINCSSWDDSVDCASIEMFNYNQPLPERFVLTTWHENEPLEEAMFFLKHTISHPEHDLENVVLLHISSKSQRNEIIAEFENA
ncbi:MAG: hypothetical protein EOO52_07010 [Gammaproteobacteria bacterium]|nr:MAG: hypothetical protein EOO52_07010 [Gammaproteobacteria bacterium]